jgi:hypothetical protein
MVDSSIVDSTTKDSESDGDANDKARELRCTNGNRRFGESTTPSISCDRVHGDPLVITLCIKDPLKAKGWAFQQHHAAQHLLSLPRCGSGSMRIGLVAALQQRTSTTVGRRNRRISIDPPTPPPPLAWWTEMLPTTVQTRGMMLQRHHHGPIPLQEIGEKIWIWQESYQSRMMSGMLAR